MYEKEERKKAFHGKEYTGDEASQRQREYETLMRKQRSDVDLLKKGKADKDTLLAARCKYQQTLHEYQAFSRKMRLPEQMERVYMDGLGRVAPQVRR